MKTKIVTVQEINPLGDGWYELRVKPANAEDFGFCYEFSEEVPKKGDVITITLEGTLVTEVTKS